MNELLKKPNEWQYIDERHNMLFAWYSKPFLDVLKNMDFSNSRILELGMGASTLWWGKVAKSVVAVDFDKKWFDMVNEGLIELNLKDKVETIYASEINDYIKPINTTGKFDVIIVDGGWRKECMLSINENNLNKGGLVILDNFEYLPEIIDSNIFRTNPFQVYPQPHHYMWRTACWKIDNFEVISNNHELNTFNQIKRRGL